LTLTPAFPGNDRQELLRQIAFDEPRPPRQVNPAIPVDIETIVLKAMEKNPIERYATAQEFADDLRRFLEDKPILARRATVRQRVGKWAKRHRGVAWMAVGLLAVLALGSTASTIIITGQLHRAEKAEDEANNNLADAQKAELEKTKQLLRALMAQAEAGLFSGQAGKRFEGLQALTEASRIARSLDAPEKLRFDLRNVAIACMAAPDMRRRPEFDRYSAAETAGFLDRLLQRFAVCDQEGTITIRGISSDEEIARLRGPGTRATWLNFSPDGRFLAAAYPRDPQQKRGQLFIWDLSRREVIFSLPPELIDPGLSWNPDSRLLAVDHWTNSRYKARTIAVYEVDSGKEIYRFAADKEFLGGVAFDSGGKRVAVLRAQGIVQIHDVDARRVADQIAFPAPIKRFAWSDDGRFLAGSYAEPPAGSDMNKGFHIFLWDALARRTKTLEGHQNTTVHVAFNHAGNLLASNAWDGTIRLWDPYTGKELLQTQGDWGALQFSRDDRFLLVNEGWGGPKHCWEVNTGQAYRRFHIPAETALSWGTPQFSPDGRLLGANCTDGCRLWDVASGRHVAWLTPESRTFYHFDEGGKTLITSSIAGAYRWPLALEDKPVGRLVRIGPPEPLPQGSAPDRGDGLLHSPDGVWAVAASPSSVTVWDARANKPLRELLHTGATVSFSPDSKWLVTHSGEECILWQVGSWTPRHRLPREQTETPRVVAFASDGKLAAVTADAKEIRVFNPASGREVARLANHGLRAQSNFAFSPDGAKLAVTTHHEFIEVWDLRAIRKQLQQMDLDWEQDPYPPSDGVLDARPLQVEADLGYMTNRGHYSLLLAYFPFYAEAYYQRGLTYLWSDQPREALADFNMAILLQPDHGEAHFGRGQVHTAEKRFPEARADFDRCIALRANHPAAHAWRAWVHLELGRFREATADFAKALELSDLEKVAAELWRIDEKFDAAFVAYFHALAWLGAEDRARYCRACALGLEHLRQDVRPHVANWLAWSAILAPDAFPDPEQALKLAEHALRNDPKNHNFLMTLAAALYRAGRLAESVQRLTEVTHLWERPMTVERMYSEAYTEFFLAMAHHRLGHDAEARQWLDKATAQMDEEMDNPNIPWNRRLTLRLLRREAEEMLQVSKKSAMRANSRAMTVMERPPSIIIHGRVPPAPSHPPIKLE
jgi:WD40 repeat protein